MFKGNRERCMLPFEGFVKNNKVEMGRPMKKKSLPSNWEGLYIFIDYKDGKGFQEQDHGDRICIFKYLKG